jgi:hypothetical protein
MEATMKKMEAFEMRLRRMSKEKEIFITIERRQLRYLGHTETDTISCSVYCREK